jgi:hypothetical protein
MAFELDLAQRFFKYRDEELSDFSDFNIFTYFSYLTYKVGSYCGLCKGWREMRKRAECKEEMLKQLDVKLLLQRINFLERATEHILDANAP